MSHFSLSLSLSFYFILQIVGLFDVEERWVWLFEICGGDISISATYDLSLTRGIIQVARY